MTQTTTEEAPASLPFHTSIVQALNQLKQGDLFDTAESTMGLKALLWHIHLTAIPKNHENIRKAIRKAIHACAEIDETLLILYERAVLHLHEQEKWAIVLARQEDDTKIRKERLEEDLKKRGEQLELRAESLSVWDDKLDSREAGLNQKEKTLAELEASLNQRKKRKPK